MYIPYHIIKPSLVFFTFRRAEWCNYFTAREEIAILASDEKLLWSPLCSWKYCSKIVWKSFSQMWNKCFLGICEMFLGGTWTNFFFNNYVFFFKTSIIIAIDAGFLLEIEINSFKQIRLKSKNMLKVIRNNGTLFKKVMNDWYLGNIAGFILNEKLWAKFTSFFQVALSLKFWKKVPS